MKISIGVNGAVPGRMGRRVIDIAYADPDVTLAAAVDMPDHPLQGRDAGEVAGVGPLGLSVTSELPPTPIDVLIDFSTPAGTMSVLPACVQRRIPLVLATTGHVPEDRAAIAKAGLEIPILYVPNTSLAVNVLIILVRRAAELLRNRNSHRNPRTPSRFKKDAPSGTALHLLRSFKKNSAKWNWPTAKKGSAVSVPPARSTIHAIRVGDNVGEHTVVFSTLGETLELTHRAYGQIAMPAGQCKRRSISRAKYQGGIRWRMCWGSVNKRSRRPPDFPGRFRMSQNELLEADRQLTPPTFNIL